MNRSMQILLVAGGLLAATLAVTVVPGQVPEIALDAAPGADHVTLYQNGLAFVEVNRTIDTSGGDALLTMSLPTTARFESLRVEGDGVTVKEVRSALSATGPLQAGDEVVVRTTTADASYEGTYLGTQEGALAIATADGVALVRPEQVVAVEVRGARAESTTPGAVEASVLVDAPAGQHQVRVTYLAQGPGWTPSYDLDVETGALSFHALLTGLHDWSNVTLDLVSGAPHVVLSPVPLPSPMPFEARLMDEAAASEAGGADAVAPPQTLGDLHRYRVQEPVDLRRGETVRLPVEEGRVAIERRYYEARADVGFGYAPGHEQVVPVLDRLELRNTLGEPLPSGVVLAYRAGTWIGEDRLDATRENGTANLTLARSQDVTARLVLERADATRGSDVATYALVVENGRDEAIDLRATLQYPAHRTRLVDAQPAPAETRGTALTWDLTVPAGESARVAATVETLVDERTPPPTVPIAETRSAGGGSSGSSSGSPETAAPDAVKEETAPVATG